MENLRKEIKTIQSNLTLHLARIHFILKKLEKKPKKDEKELISEEEIIKQRMLSMSKIVNNLTLDNPTVISKLQEGISAISNVNDKFRKTFENIKEDYVYEYAKLNEVNEILIGPIDRYLEETKKVYANKEAKIKFIRHMLYIDDLNSIKEILEIIREISKSWINAVAKFKIFYNSFSNFSASVKQIYGTVIEINNFKASQNREKEIYMQQIQPKLKNKSISETELRRGLSKLKAKHDFELLSKKKEKLPSVNKTKSSFSQFNRSYETFNTYSKELDKKIKLLLERTKELEQKFKKTEKKISHKIINFLSKMIA